MNACSLLVFDLDDARFAVDAAPAREIVWLPELAPIEEAPPWIAGMFSLRGRIVPVTDLSLRLGRPARRRTTDDRVIVLEVDGRAIGLIVSDARDVVALDAGVIQPPPEFDSKGRAHLVAGEARIEGELVILLDAQALAHDAQAPAAEAQPAGDICPEATPEERTVFRARAEALAQAAADEEGARIGLAVMEMGGECFGIELAAVQEFCAVARPTPIPCCPPHIMGTIGLRGNLLTLVDPRAALDLKPAPAGVAKAVVARHGEQQIALAVDEVHDIVYLRPDEIRPPPPLLRERHGPEIRGTAPFAGRTMAVLDLPALLAREGWIVNESV